MKLSIITDPSSHVPDTDGELDNQLLTSYAGVARTPYTNGR